MEKIKVLVKTKKSERIQLIINYLKNYENATITDIIEYVNKNVSVIGHPIAKRTFESDLQSMRKNFGIKINVTREGNVCYYSIDTKSISNNVLVG